MIKKNSPNSSNFLKTYINIDTSKLNNSANIGIDTSNIDITNINNIMNKYFILNKKINLFISKYEKT